MMLIMIIMIIFMHKCTKNVNYFLCKVVKFIFALLQMNNGKFDADAGLANIEKLPPEFGAPLKDAVNKCRDADKGSVT